MPVQVQGVAQREPGDIAQRLGGQFTGGPINDAGDGAAGQQRTRRPRNRHAPRFAGSGGRQARSQRPKLLGERSRALVAGPARRDPLGHPVEQRDRRGRGRAVGVQRREPGACRGEVGVDRGGPGQMAEGVVTRPHRHARQHGAGDGQQSVRLEPAALPGTFGPTRRSPWRASRTRKSASRASTLAAAGVVATFTARQGVTPPGAVTSTVRLALGSRDASSRRPGCPGCSAARAGPPRRPCPGRLCAGPGQPERGGPGRHGVRPTTTRPAASDAAAPGRRRSSAIAVWIGACVQVTPGGGASSEWQAQRSASAVSSTSRMARRSDGSATYSRSDHDRAGSSDPAGPPPPAAAVIQQHDRGPGGQGAQFRGGTADGPQPRRDAYGHRPGRRQQPPALSRSGPWCSHGSP